jgi:UDP-glucose 4-epimerase
MKKIVIVGKNSYIGKNLIELLSKDKGAYEVIEYDTMTQKVSEMDFKGADSVYHVAGIAHVSSDPKMKDKFFEINRDLAIETAKKAKADGAGQFIFMSSMIIYGNVDRYGKKFEIDDKTPFNAVDFYGQSKLEADLAIQQLNCDNFKTAIIRSPMVFGKNCKGNFPTLVNFAKKSFVFPNVKNERSMIYIENLVNFVKLLIDNGSQGIFYPQNKEYFSTTEIVKTAASYTVKRFGLQNYSTMIYSFYQKFQA